MSCICDAHQLFSLGKRIPSVPLNTSMFGCTATYCPLWIHRDVCHALLTCFRTSCTHQIQLRSQQREALCSSLWEKFIRVVLLKCQRLSLTPEPTRPPLFLISACLKHVCLIQRKWLKDTKGTVRLNSQILTQLEKLIKMQLNEITATGVQYLSINCWVEKHFLMLLRCKLVCLCQRQEDLRCRAQGKSNSMYVLNNKSQRTEQKCCTFSRLLTE